MLTRYRTEALNNHSRDKELAKGYTMYPKEGRSMIR
jgi:hypothetical protein